MPWALPTVLAFLAETQKLILVVASKRSLGFTDYVSKLPLSGPNLN